LIIKKEGGLMIQVAFIILAAGLSVYIAPKNVPAHTTKPSQ
jgi:hypothetical protein